MLKKILTLCLVLCMLASVPAFAALEDIAGEKFEKEISLLNSIGIVEGKEPNAYKPADKLTRAEMTTIVLRLIDVEPTVPAAFEDVAADHWASKIIGSAAQLGIINGMSATTFAPEENVTYPQAAKMLVCTLGYGVKAEGLGGYPTGYIAVASQLGVLKGTSDDGAPISRAVMAKMVANCLEVDLMERTGYGSEVTFEAQPGVNLLNKYLDIAIFEGTIDGSYTLNLGGASCEEDEIAIGTDIIKVGETNAASFIGRSVTIYAKENADEETFTALQVEAAKNSEYFTIDAEDVLPTTTATELWWDNGSTKEMFEIADTCTYVNNGGVVGSIDLTAVSGKITVSSADGNEADIIFVESYQDAVVEKVNKTSGLITFKAPILNPAGSPISTITLDEENDSVKFSITDAEGKAVAVKDLQEWDVLSITMNGAQTLYSIALSRDEFQGKITEYNANDDEAVINTKTYEIATSLVNADGDLIPTAVNLEAKFYKNAYGKIVAADTEGIKEYSYGYMVRYHKEDGMEGKETVKIFTEDGVMKQFTLNEDYTKSPEIDLEQEYLLQYKLNNAGEILELKYMAPTVPEDRTFIGAPISAFGWKYKVLDSTKIFVVPDSYTGNDALYGFYDHSNLVNHASVPNVEVFDLDDANNIGVALSRGSSGVPSQVGVVKKISSVTKNGETLIRLTLTVARTGDVTIDLKEGTTSIRYSARAFTSEKIVPGRPKDASSAPYVAFEGGLSGIEVGDVVWFASKNSEGISNAIQVIMRANHQMTNNRAFAMGDANRTYSDGCWNVETQYVFGFIDTIKEINKNGVVFETTYDSDSGSGSTAITWTTETATLEFATLSAETVVLYDMARKTFVNISPEEIQEDDNIFAYRVGFKTILTVVYRNVPASAQSIETTDRVHSHYAGGNSSAWASLLTPYGKGPLAE